MHLAKLHLMKRQFWLRFWPSVLLIAGCNAFNSQSQPVAMSTASESPRSPEAVTRSPDAPIPDSTNPDSTNPDLTNPDSATPDPAHLDSSMQLDYEAMTPLPSTGKVTIRDSMRNLDLSRLIADCPPDSAPYAFAESTHYQVQICSQEYDPWQPKYYIGQAKDGSGELRITSSDPEAARQLIFRHDGYAYVIYRDSARPEQTNAYLEIYSPDGQNYAEALIYLYETGPAPQ